MENMTVGRTELWMGALRGAGAIKKPRVRDRHVQCVPARLRNYSGVSVLAAPPVSPTVYLSNFHKWIYHSLALTRPPRQDSPPSTEPCKLLLNLTMRSQNHRSCDITVSLSGCKRRL
ncbi:unnamed protein product [Pleuronectes platessa]|uniref:Uncharacterized protein n=1 Tax=Pleuronectes platessa TaxID=8262 RepID=A0A9N7UY22_PLEPL|nr:unnamed protein product [Pleuronectes platessa]